MKLQFIHMQRQSYKRGEDESEAVGRKNLNAEKIWVICVGTVVLTHGLLLLLLMMMFLLLLSLFISSYLFYGCCLSRISSKMIETWPRRDNRQAKYKLFQVSIIYQNLSTRSDTSERVITSATSFGATSGSIIILVFISIYSQLHLLCLTISWSTPSKYYLFPLAIFCANFYTFKYRSF